MTREDATGWFDELYRAAARGEAVVPWDRGGPHPLVAEWAEATRPDGRGRSALVVGAGLGGDAELVARLGFDTTAFDVAPAAVEEARRRHPGSRVSYLVADLFHAAADWRAAFDLVLESLTVQSLPERLREEAIAAVTELVAPGGTLLVIANARDEDEPVEGPPWPLTRAQVDSFARDGLQPVRIEELRDAADPGIRRWRAELRRAV